MTEELLLPPTGHASFKPTLCIGLASWSVGASDGQSLTIVASRSSDKSHSQVQAWVQAGVAFGGKFFASKWLAFSLCGITIRVLISVGPNNHRLACLFA